MEEYPVENLVCSEKVMPKRRFLRSDGALYVVLLICVFAIILTGNALSAAWDLPRFYVQVTLYAILICIGYVVYRKCLLAFRYALTDRMLCVDRLVGKKEKFDECVHLSDITSIRPMGAETSDPGKYRALYTGSRKQAMAVTACTAGRKTTLLISPSEEFAGKLMEQWKIARK
jgi:hypothetical protein